MQTMDAYTDQCRVLSKNEGFGRVYMWNKFDLQTQRQLGRLLCIEIDVCMCVNELDRTQQQAQCPRFVQVD